MNALIDRFANALKQVLRRAVSEPQGSYVLITGEVEDGLRVVICATKGYAKILLYENAPSLDCKELEYEPLGLYAFSEDPDELAKKVLSKVSNLCLRKRADLF